MKIHPIQWRKDGYGLRLVALPSNRVRECVSNWRERRPSLKCSYWQIWWNGSERYVVDRALTKRKAIERINQLKEAQAALMSSVKHNTPYETQYHEDLFYYPRAAE